MTHPPSVPCIGYVSTTTLTLTTDVNIKSFRRRKKNNKKCAKARKCGSAALCKCRIIELTPVSFRVVQAHTSCPPSPPSQWQPVHITLISAGVNNFPGRVLMRWGRERLRWIVMGSVLRESAGPDRWAWHIWSCQRLWTQHRVTSSLPRRSRKERRIVIGSEVLVLSHQLVRVSWWWWSSSRVQWRQEWARVISGGRGSLSSLCEQNADVTIVERVGNVRSRLICGGQFKYLSM